MKVLDEIVEFLEVLTTELKDVFIDLGQILFCVFLVFTLPIWIIPYKIVKKRRTQKSKTKNTSAPYNCKCVVYTSPPDDRVRQSETQPKAIYQSYNSHDCEAWYKCPVCNEMFSSWSVYHQSKNENGTNKYCPKCKRELSGLD